MHPCISNTRSPVWFTVGRKKKKTIITQCCRSELPALHEGPLTVVVMFEMQQKLGLSIADEPFLHFFLHFFFISQWNNIRYGWRWANKFKQRWMLCTGRSCCLICSTQPSKAEARQAIRGSSCWALDCIPLTFIQWFMSEDLSPSQWDLHTQLFKTHNGEKRMEGGKKT